MSLRVFRDVAQDNRSPYEVLIAEILLKQTSELRPKRLGAGPA